MEGTQYRNVYCYHGNKLASEHPEIKCDMSDKPPTKQVCTRTTGCHPRWVIEGNVSLFNYRYNTFMYKYITLVQWIMWLDRKNSYMHARQCSCQ